MKKIYFILGVIILYIPLGNTKGFCNKIFVSLNLNDCINSLNGLNTLHQLSDQIDLYFVFPSEYQMDSADLVESLKLYHYNGQYIWSDSVYKESILS